MTTRRRIICSILSLFLLSSCAVFATKPPDRIVRVKALADVSFRARNPGWADEARGLIEAASDYYEREFDVRFVTESVVAWPAQERIHSTVDLLARIKQDFPSQKRDGSYDLIVAFTAEGISRYFVAGRPRVDRIGNCQHGLGNYVVAPVNKLFRYSGAHAEPEPDVVALIHELAHIFGAEHVDDRASIMFEDFGYRTEFDDKNRRVIAKNRLCPFARD
jgi:Metallo-peptidase family M12